MANAFQQPASDSALFSRQLLSRISKDSKDMILLFIHYTSMNLVNILGTLQDEPFLNPFAPITYILLWYALITVCVQSSVPL